MGKFFTTTLIALILGGCLTAQNFHITGLTTDLPDGTVVLLRNVDVERPIDTAYIKDSRFQFKGVVKEAYNQYVLIIREMERTRPAFFFVENTGIKIDLRNKKYINDAVITGGKIQNQQAELVALLSKTKAKYDSLNALYRLAKDPDQRNDLNKKQSPLYLKMEADKLTFIRSHPDYEFSAFMLDELSINSSNSEIQDLYDLLTDNVKQSKYGKQMARYLALSKDFAPGSTAENFTLTDLNGEKVELDSFRGKYVYLDFWASWCGPCRAQHAGLADLYKKYKSKGFEILSLSLDTDKTKWKTAIEKDNMTWTNLHDPLSFKGDAALTYKIYSIPMSLLIDPEGKIVSKYTNGFHDLEQRLPGYFGE